VVQDIIRLILDFFVATKSWIITDIDWGTLFLLCLAATGGLRYLAAKYTKNFNAAELQEKWWGKAAIKVHEGRNRVLRWGLTASSVFLAFAFITVGSQRNGAVADAGSGLTNLESGQYEIMMNCGEETGKTVLYCRQLHLDEAEQVAQKPEGSVFKAGEMEIATGTSLQPGAFIEISLSQGKTWISGLSENQAQARLEQNDNMYQSLKRSLATMF
jgi:hypothetical protein